MKVKIILVLIFVMANLLHIPFTTVAQEQEEAASVIIHEGEINSLEFSPNSERLALQGVGGVYIYDHTGILIKHLEDTITRADQGFPDTTYSMVALAWGSDSNSLIAPYEWIGPQESGMRLKVWNLTDNSYIELIDDRSFPFGSVTSIDWDTNENYVAIATSGATFRGEGRYFITLRNPTSDDPAQHIATFGRSYDWISALDWHPNGRWLAAAYANGYVKYWDTEHEDIEITNSGDHQDAEGEFVRIFERHDISANDVVWSYDGTQIASAGDDSKIVIRKYENINEFDTVDDFRISDPIFIDKPFGAVLALAWNPDGTLLASGGEEGLVYIWDTETGESVTILSSHQGAIHALDWSSDGNWIATAGRDKTVRLWDMSDLRNRR